MPKEIKCKNSKFVSQRVTNIVGKVGNTANQHFLHFPQCFRMASLSGSLRVGIVWYRVNPFPNKPLFLRVCSTRFLKTLWGNRKLLVTSNFSFSHSVFYPFGEPSAIFIKSKIAVCIRLLFGRV